MSARRLFGGREGFGFAGSGSEFEELEESGFAWLYSEDNLEKYSELRLRLQRLWSSPLKALISEPEEA